MVSEQPTRKVVKALRDAGFTRLRGSGSHSVWGKGSVTIPVPDGHRTISPGVYRKIIDAIEEAGK